MEKKNDGGPAYPVLHSIDGNWVKEPVPEFRGMSLRDHFAGLAMQGHWSNAHGDSTLDWMQANPELEDGQLRIVAKLAYAQADAMLKAREQ